MRNEYEQMITVSEYAKSLKQYNPADENSMTTVEEYVKALQEECAAAQVSTMITVAEYVKSLRQDRLTAEEKEMEANLEEFLTASKKAKKDAQTLEDLCA